MADFDPMMQAGMPAPEASVEPSAKAGFLANPKARLAAIIGGAVALLAIVGVVAVLVLQSFATDTAQQVATQIVTKSINSTPAKAAVATDAAGVTGNKQPTEVTDSDAFIARDPFEPVLHELPPVQIATPTVPATAGGPAPGSSPTTQAGPSAPAAPNNTLTLENIFTDNGKYKAVLSWNGDKYEVGEGDQLGSTPWKVLSLTRSTATMQYGDLQVTLSIGEGVQQ